MKLIEKKLMPPVDTIYEVTLELTASEIKAIKALQLITEFDVTIPEMFGRRFTPGFDQAQAALTGLRQVLNSVLRS